MYKYLCGSLVDRYNINVGKSPSIFERYLIREVNMHRKSSQSSSYTPRDMNDAVLIYNHPTYLYIYKKQVYKYII